MFIFLNIISIIIVFFIGADILSLADEMVYCKATNTRLLERKYSICKACGHRLRLKDTFPVVSRFVNKGICRFCDTPFDKRDYDAQLIGGMLAVIIYVLLSFIAKLSILPTILIMTVLLVICLEITVWYFRREDKKAGRSYEFHEIEDEPTAKMIKYMDTDSDKKDKKDKKDKATKAKSKAEKDEIGLINLDGLKK